MISLGKLFSNTISPSPLSSTGSIYSLFAGSRWTFLSNSQCVSLAPPLKMPNPSRIAFAAAAAPLTYYVCTRGKSLLFFCYQFSFTRNWVNEMRRERTTTVISASVHPVCASWLINAGIVLCISLLYWRRHCRRAVRKSEPRRQQASKAGRENENRQKCPARHLNFNSTPSRINNWAQRS